MAARKERKRIQMTKRIIPGVILAIMGVGLFTYQAYGLSVRKNMVAANSTVRNTRNFAANGSANDEEFPAISLLAGFLFMSGIGVAAVSANQTLRAQQENLEA
jgi:hypothetical protein